MRPRAVPVAVVLLLLLSAFPRPAFAQETRLNGVIVGIQSSQETFVLREVNTFLPGRIWTVRVTAATQVRRSDDLVGRGTQPALRLLRVGDQVQVQGWLTGGAQMVARAVLVRQGRGDEDDDRRRGQEIRFTGVVVTVDDRGQGILQVQARTFGPAYNAWTVRLHPQTRVEVRDRDRWRGRRDVRGRDLWRLFRVGDLVEVEGRIIGNRQIQAREITVQGHTGTPVPYPPYPAPNPYPSPYPTPYPYPGQTIILSPTEGAVITGSEFSVIGQTVPGAQVRVDVRARLGVFQLPVTSGTVQANQSGSFAFEVRPQMRAPGTIYTITVTSTFQGYTSPPVSVTARQQ